MAFELASSETVNPAPSLEHNKRKAPLVTPAIGARIRLLGNLTSPITTGLIKFFSGLSGWGVCRKPSNLADGDSSQLSRCCCDRVCVWLFVFFCDNAVIINKRAVSSSIFAFIQGHVGFFNKNALSAGMIGES